MPIYEEERPVERRIVEEPVVERRVVEEPLVEQQVVRRSSASNDFANYALVKYGFTLVMTIIILYFIARYLIPLVR
ncbi:MAG TPA: hypothetical protein VM754_11560 [Actinomycetota bacterium]|nr:hypothetical protein [Actinomycetota bacterium]